jgi:hypothetical protein
MKSFFSALILIFFSINIATAHNETMSPYPTFADNLTIGNPDDKISINSNDIITF